MFRLRGVGYVVSVSCVRRRSGRRLSSQRVKPDFGTYVEAPAMLCSSADLDAGVGQERVRRHGEIARAPGRGARGRRCRIANRGTGRASRRNRREGLAGMQPRCVHTPTTISHSAFSFGAPSAVAVDVAVVGGGAPFIGVAASLGAGDAGAGAAASAVGAAAVCAGAGAGEAAFVADAGAAEAAGAAFTLGESRFASVAGASGEKLALRARGSRSSETGTASASWISLGVRRRMNTGLPRHITLRI